MTNSNTSKPAAKKPVFRKILPGGISSAVFENTRDGRTYRSVNLQRSYRKDNQWNRMSMYLDHEHIPFVIEVLQGTWQFLNEHPIGGNQASDVDAESGNAVGHHDDTAANAQSEVVSEFEA